MWLKLIIFIGLGYMIYRAIAGPSEAKPKVRSERTDPRQIDDVMVQDPVCKVYFPQREGIRAKVGGQIVYFCSEECMKKYMNKNKQ